MKIIHCLNHYFPDHIAGTEVYVSALARELKTQGVISKVLIPHYDMKEDHRFYFEGTEIIKYAEPSVPDRALITGQKAPQGLGQFIEIIKKEQPDIVHFHELAGSNGISLFHVKAVKELGVRSVMTFHIAKYSCRTGTLMYMNEVPCDGVIRKIRCSKCLLNDRGEKGLRAKLITTGFTLTNALHFDTRKWNNSIGTALAFPNIITQLKEDLLSLQQHTNAFVSLTDWYRAVLLRNGISENDLHVIPQALPSDAQHTGKEPVPDGRLRLVFIGRINHFKGILLLINAVRRFPAHLVSLDLYGAATEQEYMDECLRASEGMDNISWKGIIDPTAVVNTISSYDVFCLPSAVCEMAPLVIQEAFAAGVPVLASDVYGNAEQIKHKVNGWLFKFKDVDDLAANLEKLINNRKMIEDASLQIIGVRKFNEVAKEQKKVYEKVLAI